jgi:hypothetical protein
MSNINLKQAQQPALETLPHRPLMLPASRLRNLVNIDQDVLFQEFSGHTNIARREGGLSESGMRGTGLVWGCWDGK